MTCRFQNSLFITVFLLSFLLELECSTESIVSGWSLLSGENMYETGDSSKECLVGVKRQYDVASYPGVSSQYLEHLTSYYNNFYYVYGSCGDDDFWVYDMNIGLWKWLSGTPNTGSSMNPSTPDDLFDPNYTPGWSGGRKMKASKSGVYLLFEYNCIENVWYFNVTNKMWKFRKSGCPGINQKSGCAWLLETVDDEILCQYGGFYSSDQYPQDYVICYTFSTNSFSVLYNRGTCVNVNYGGKIPGSRLLTTGWEYNGLFYMYGGTGDPNCMAGDWNFHDIWSFDYFTQTWEPVGIQNTDPPTVYGTLDQFSSSNNPGQIMEYILAPSSEGLPSVFLYGGWTEEYFFKKELWEFSITMEEWRYLGGRNQLNHRAKFESGVSNDPGSRIGTPESASSHVITGVFYRDFVYIFGGGVFNYQYCHGDDEEAVTKNWNDFWMYDLSLDIRYSCNGYDYNDPNSCSSHGKCVGWDTCSCFSMFKGVNCSLAKEICYSFTEDLVQHVCSGNGNCTSRNKCVCLNGFYGERCENVGFPPNITCNGYIPGDGRECLSRGKCIAEDFCECWNSYEGSDCESWSCGGIKYDDDDDADEDDNSKKPKVCNGRGKCILPNICDCKSGYSGDLCEKNDRLAWILGPVLSVSGVGGVLCCVFTLCLFCSFVCSILCFGFMICLCSISGLSTIVFQQTFRMKRFQKLRNFDLLLQEQEMEGDTSIAHLRINQELFKVPYDEVKVSRILGEGGSNAIVFLAEWQGKEIAFKCFKTKDLCSSQDRFVEFETEVQVLSSLAHPHIIRFYGATLRPPRVGILMEYCENGEVLDFIVNYRQKDYFGYPISEKIRMCRECVSAMEFIHCRNIIHRDLKPENILVDGNQSCKMMDFGLSRVVKNQDLTKTKRIGTNCYMAPEIISEQKEPYKDEDVFQIELRVANDPKFRPKLETLSRSLAKNKAYDWIQEVIVKCWDHDPIFRYSFAEILQIIDDKADKDVSFSGENKMIINEVTEMKEKNIKTKKGTIISSIILSSSPKRSTATRQKQTQSLKLPPRKDYLINGKPQRKLPTMPKKKENTNTSEKNDKDNGK